MVPHAGAVVSWEQLEQLHHQFPHTLAWGMPVLKGAYTMSTTTSPATTDVQATSDEIKTSNSRHKCICRPIVRVLGPDWIV